MVNADISRPGLLLACLLAQVPDDPTELAALVLDALAWRRWWTADMVALRAEQFEAEIAQRLKDAAVAISSGADWVRVAYAPSYAELVRRRAVLGPLARTPDREALAEWARTGRTSATGRGAA
ncbi:MAG: hypothetical protein JOZ47_14120 [Kutzneria sp.]|nr:hypothetical protein [Kutzneria sp.]